MLPPRLLLAAALLLLLGLSAIAHAEPSAQGAIAGSVRLADSDEPFAGVEVIVRGAGEERRAITDQEGRFRVEPLAPGRYRVETALDGFAPAAVEIDVGGEPATVELRLRVAADEVIEIEGQTQAQRLRESAEAVQVIETAEAQRQSADLGEVVSRGQGVSVRRSGGLGSVARLSLAGLTDDQIRFFLDGVPLELAGFALGIANVPVHLVDRVEIYRGVVPIRFGADALGGAVNLASDEVPRGTHASAAYQVGSFGTHRLALDASRRSEGGLLVRLDGFLDRTRNDYAVDVEVVDDRGRLSPATIDRFHDGYQAGGVGAEVGIVDRPWARRLLLRGYVTRYERDLQHNLVMTVPYGEVTYGETAGGAVVRFERALGAAGRLDVTGGYSVARATFLDVGQCVYDWYGDCVRDRAEPGEIDARPLDQVFREHAAFGRANAEWRLGRWAAIRSAIAPTFVTRTGDERAQLDPTARDPLTAERALLTLVSGLEIELDLLGDRLEDVAFVKDYVQIARAEELTPSGSLRRRDRDTHGIGAGNALRYRLHDQVYGKASYEWATRLPRPDEVFGDAALVAANLELVPERSHNANLGVTAEIGGTPYGAWRLDVNAFLRDAKRLIVLLGNDRFFTYQNVFSARSVGAEVAAGWTSPGDHVAIDGNATYQAFRNTSDAGAFADYEGDRIPNRPYLLANGSVRLQRTGIARAGDELSLGWHTRYVHAFFRGWESIGLIESKQVVPAQLLHAAAVTYAVRVAGWTASSSIEVGNLTDARAFDFFGVQRPGRALYVKSAVSF